MNNGRMDETDICEHANNRNPAREFVSPWRFSILTLNYLLYIYIEKTVLLKCVLKNLTRFENNFVGPSK